MGESGGRKEIEEIGDGVVIRKFLEIKKPSAEELVTAAKHSVNNPRKKGLTGKGGGRSSLNGKAENWKMGHVHREWTPRVRLPP